MFSLFSPKSGSIIYEIKNLQLKIHALKTRIILRMLLIRSVYSLSAFSVKETRRSLTIAKISNERIRARYVSSDVHYGVVGSNGKSTFYTHSCIIVAVDGFSISVLIVPPSGVRSAASNAAASSSSLNSSEASSGIVVMSSIGGKSFPFSSR